MAGIHCASLKPAHLYAQWIVWLCTFATLAVVNVVIALLAVHTLEVFHSGVDFGLLLLLFDVALVVVYFIFMALRDTCKRGTYLLPPSIRIVCASTVPTI